MISDDGGDQPEWPEWIAIPVLHEGVLELVRNHPAFAADLLGQLLHVELPHFTEARLAESTLDELVPVEYRADAVVLFEDTRPWIASPSSSSRRAQLADRLGQHSRELYSILIEAALSEAARKVVEMQPGLEKFFTEAQRRLYDRGKAEGKAEEAARLVLKLLSRRGIAITDAQRRQILECSDLAVLDRWQDLAFSVTSVEELFA
jgi:hypothetical protein